jgi:hypothetical protein
MNFFLRNSFIADPFILVATGCLRISTTTAAGLWSETYKPVLRWVTNLWRIKTHLRMECTLIFLPGNARCTAPTIILPTRALTRWFEQPNTFMRLTSLTPELSTTLTSDPT